MKALTVYQPWASLIMAGAKPFEFRTYAAPKWMVGARFVIHAGARRIVREEVLDLLQRLDDGGTTGLKAEIARPILERLLNAHADSHVLPLASGLGTAVMGTSRKASAIFAGVADSDRIDQHKWAWPLGAIKAFSPIVPMRGAQGFWEWQA